jgi:uncharacterized protein (TIGR03435 family)
MALDARKYSMAMLANLLSGIGPGPVIDKTGLPGAYTSSCRGMKMPDRLFLHLSRTSSTPA